MLKALQFNDRRSCNLLIRENFESLDLKIFDEKISCFFNVLMSSYLWTKKYHEYIKNPVKLVEKFVEFSGWGAKPPSGWWLIPPRCAGICERCTQRLYTRHRGPWVEYLNGVVGAKCPSTWNMLILNTLDGGFQGGGGVHEYETLKNQKFISRINTPTGDFGGKTPSRPALDGGSGDLSSMHMERLVWLKMHFTN